MIEFLGSLVNLLAMFSASMTIINRFWQLGYRFVMKVNPQYVIKILLFTLVLPIPSKTGTDNYSKNRNGMCEEG